MKRKAPKILSFKEVQRMHRKASGRPTKGVQDSLDRLFRPVRNQRGIFPIAGILAIVGAVWLCGYILATKATKENVGTIQRGR